MPCCEFFYDRIAKFYACDIFYDDWDFNAFRQNMSRFLKPDFDSKVEIIKDDSLKLVTHFPEGTEMEKFIYCSVDGHHTYEHTYSDLSFCAKHLVPGGVIVLDDVYHFRWPEVSNALYDLLREYSYLKMLFVLDNRVVLTEDLDITDAVYDPAMFTRKKMKDRFITGLTQN